MELLLEMITESVSSRFHSKFSKLEDFVCWEWSGARWSTGYGAFYLHGRQTNAHRISWVIHNQQSIPEKMDILHRCDNPPCVNPNHLFMGTCADNIADKIAKGRDARGLTHGWYTKPESRLFGDKNPTRTRPETRPRGDKHYNHLHPENVRGENAGGAKLTEVQVLDIRKAAQEGVSAKILSEKYNVCRSSIYGIINRTQWRYTP